ncbi:MAG: YebC/PmpR family DNA-binding transcriptional regulator [bacterium]|nr:YebC/PmpR family DNA-binding transcriptional regulator [bacterium]
MAGHSKWAQIKRQKGSEDAKRSKLFSKLSRLISTEAKRSGGNLSSPSLRATLEKAKKENMPKDTIERAIRKGSESGGELKEVRYEAYGPGGVAIVIEGYTDNNNRTAQELKHLLSSRGASLAATGAALWAFKKSDEGWEPATTVSLSEADQEKLAEIIEALEAHDDVEMVFTNAA